MKENRKKHMLSKVSVCMVVISFLMVSCLGDKVMASGTNSMESGTDEGVMNNIFQVIFPTDTEHVFDFIMDPQKLISQTNAAAYEGSTFEKDGTLFFKRTDGGVPEDYSSSSDTLVIANMGTADVELVLTANVSLDEAEGITMTDDCDFTDDTRASFYLALTDGQQTVAIDDEEGAFISTRLEGIPRGSGTRSEYRFWLVGAANEKGDWSSITGGIPKVIVTWHAASCETPALGDTLQDEEVLPEDIEPPTVNENETEENIPVQTDLPEENAGQEQLGEPEAEEMSEGNNSQEQTEAPAEWKKGI